MLGINRSESFKGVAILDESAVSSRSRLNIYKDISHQAFRADGSDCVPAYSFTDIFCDQQFRFYRSVVHNNHLTDGPGISAQKADVVTFLQTVHTVKKCDNMNVF